MKSAAPAERPLTASEWKRVAVIAAGMMGHSYSIGSIFSYVGIMAEDADAAGFVASLLSSALTVARLPTASLWGHAAERYGTGRALRASCAAMALGNALFGLCTTLAAALLVRGVLLGACNGFVTLMAPMSGGMEMRALTTSIRRPKMSPIPRSRNACTCAGEIGG